MNPDQVKVDANSTPVIYYDKDGKRIELAKGKGETPFQEECFEQTKKEAIVPKHN